MDENRLLAIALQQQSQQHEQQLLDVLEHVKTLSEQLISLSEQVTSMQKSTENLGATSTNKHQLLDIIMMTEVQFPDIQCSGCRHAHWYTKRDSNSLSFGCLISRIDEPVTRCSQFDKL